MSVTAASASEEKGIEEEINQEAAKGTECTERREGEKEVGGGCLCLLFFLAHSFFFHLP